MSDRLIFSNYVASGRCSMAVPVEFVVGESFSSYTQLQEKIESYQKEKFIQLTHRDSRTLEKE